MPTVQLRARARHDLVQHIAYLTLEAGVDVALRFHSAVTDTAEALARMPRMGSEYGFQRASLRRVRRWPVKGFESWLMFYVAKRDGVDIVRIIHGARDIPTLMGDTG